MAKALLREWQATDWEKIFTLHILIKDLYPDYMHINIYLYVCVFKINKKIFKQQKIWTDTLPKKIYKWQISIWKYVNLLVIREL